MLDIRSTELNLIPIFVAIYEERSLSRAATRMEISQPAVSKALKRLREIYGDPLFNRKVVGMEPTSFAIDIYPAMAAALKNFSSTLSTSRTSIRALPSESSPSPVSDWSAPNWFRRCCARSGLTPRVFRSRCIPSLPRIWRVTCGCSVMTSSST
ncbi:LysR family transcriptional regulator [Aeromonas veronii]|uniref:helix-turn-helix domain-containing protein n=1 Tax=Aeromonas veronii TaxID=654 RepID=UPI001FFEAD43|nr:LysR family transcriptional regulator [Aeromonas veronii]UPK53829.1 LysR family transcriptional regulator [Aeromonas veronii]